MKKQKQVKTDEPTLRTLQNDVQGLAVNVDTLRTDIHEVLSAVSVHATKTEKRFDRMDNRFDCMDKRFDRMDKRFDEVEGRVKDIEQVMVTREYLDEKLLDLRGDMITLLRKEDHTITLMAQILREKKVFSDDDMKRLSLQRSVPLHA